MRLPIPGNSGARIGSRIGLASATRFLPAKPIRRVLALPSAVILVLIAMPWVLSFVEGRWLSTPGRHVLQVADSVITALLGVWILTMIRREQEVSLLHLAELEQLSLTDPLTGLGNRRSFERDLEVALKRAQRTSTRLALLYLDVDDFKLINDRYGHAVGDETLRALGAVLRSCSRLGSDSAYRVGGDEFVMVLAADAQGAELMESRLVEKFRERSPRGSRVSTGVVIWDGESRLQRLIDEADTRMYRHKRPGLGGAKA